MGFEPGPARLKRYLVNPFSYLKQHPEEAALLDQHMQHSAAVAEAYDLSGVRLVVLRGRWRQRRLSSHSLMANADGLLYDQEAVVAAAPELLAEAGLAGRCRVEAGDFFANVPSGGDCYTLSRILHDWNEKRYLRAESKLHRIRRPRSSFCTGPA